MEELAITEVATLASTDVWEVTMLIVVADAEDVVTTLDDDVTSAVELVAELVA